MHRQLLHFRYLFLLLPFLIHSAAAHGDIRPPYGCEDCGNYLRYGFVTADMAGWTADEGLWSVEPPLQTSTTTSNAIWPERISAAGFAMLYQQFTVPSRVLDRSGFPPPSDRYWISVSYRKRSLFADDSRTETSFSLDVIDGNGGVVRSHEFSTTLSDWRREMIGPFHLGSDATDNHFTFRLITASQNLLIDDLGFWVEGTQDKAGLCDWEALSSPGDAVRARLDELTGEDDNFFSELTRCNNLPGEENPLPRGWIWENPRLGNPPTAADSDAFYQAIADEIRETSSTFVLSSLHIDNRRLESGDTLTKRYLAPALWDLSDRFQGVEPSHWPSVRIILSPALGGVGQEYPTAEDIYSALTRSSPTSSRLRVRLSVAEVGVVLGQAWNHTKIAVRDRQFAIVGGQNWENGYIEPEAGQAPVYDLNMRLQGDAARAADRMFEKLWSRRRSLLPSPDPDGSDTCVGFHCTLTGEPAFSHLPPVGEYGGLNVFALGRGHTAPFPWAWNLDQSADHAVVAAISSAEEKIEISQHQLHLFGGMADIVWEAVFERMIEAPIEVEIVVSDPWGAPPFFSVETQARLATEIFEDVAIIHGLSQKEIDDVYCRLSWAPFRPTAAALGLEIQAHNKYWRIDGEAFYVGSQNFYPSAIGRSSGSDLNEFGFMVDDESYAQEIGADYFGVLWSNAEAQDEVIRSPQFGGECPTTVPEPEVCDGVDNDLDGQVDEGNVCGCTLEGYETKLYWFCNTAVSWPTAEAACQALPGSLAKIEDSDENDWIASKSDTQVRWIGLSDLETEGVWLWTDETVPTYLNWAPIEPNGGSNENCANMWDGGSWNDLYCDWLEPFVCEQEGPM
ncbi:MAG: hypothetical protein K0U98_08270 [Deltaproteobacteria bacterium]|nr:hypothetical protein [Deltaproteobacteria bacterium]